MENKRCAKCKSRKSPEMFATDTNRSDSLFPYCKTCVRKYQKVYTARPKPAPPSENFRVCSQCSAQKPLTEFYQDASRSDGYTKVCKVCRCAKRQEYALAHPEKVAADKAAWSRTRKGKAANRRSYEKNREATNARIRQRYADNPNKILSKLSAWRIRNPEKAQAIIDRGNAKRAERLANCPINDFTRTDWLLMLAAFEYLCAYCGKNDRCLEMDHVIPLSKGGSHTAPNIVPACRSCNAKKGAKILT